MSYYSQQCVNTIVEKSCGFLSATFFIGFMSINSRKKTLFLSKSEHFICMCFSIIGNEKSLKKHDKFIDLKGFTWYIITCPKRHQKLLKLLKKRVDEVNDT